MDVGYDDDVAAALLTADETGPWRDTFFDTLGTLRGRYGLTLAARYDGPDGREQAYALSNGARPPDTGAWLNTGADLEFWTSGVPPDTSVRLTAPSTPVAATYEYLDHCPPDRNIGVPDRYTARLRVTRLDDGSAADMLHEHFPGLVDGRD
ncbi:MAG: hypothetical protein ABEK12_03995 [Candidatus Nanohaloarchaea archaeon]